MNRALVFVCALLFGLQVQAGEQRWDFRVLLDGDPVGTHRFVLEERNGSRLLQSKAQFDVRFLFFTAFRYRHDNTEVWRDGCLQDIEARTVSNGKTIVVEGEREKGNFIVETAAEQRELPACIMTFAYWNPKFLKESRLLNPQTGEFLDVEVESLPSETLEVVGKTVEASRYRILARDIEVELWYSDSQEWLALESVVAGGRRLRYEPI